MVIQGRHGNPLTLGTAAAFAAAILVLYIESTVRAQIESTAPEIESTSAPAVLTAREKTLGMLLGIEGRAKQIYDVARVGNWGTAGEVVGWFRSAYPEVSQDVVGHGVSKYDLAVAIDALEGSIKGRNALNAMAASNAIISAVIDMKQSYDPPVPGEVEKLGCYSREIHIRAGAERLQDLGVTAKTIQDTWREARGGAILHGGAGPAKSIDEIVDKLQSAVTSDEYEALAQPLRENAEKIEAAYLQAAARK